MRSRPCTTGSLSSSPASRTSSRAWSRTLRSGSSLLTSTKASRNGCTVPSRSLSPEALEEMVGDWYKRMFRLTKTFATKDPHLAQIAETTRKSLEEFKVNLPVVAAICNPGMRGRHWVKVSDMVGFDVQPDENTSLASLLERGIAKHEQELQVAIPSRLPCLGPLPP